MTLLFVPCSFGSSSVSIAIFNLNSSSFPPRHFTNLTFFLSFFNKFTTALITTRRRHSASCPTFVRSGVSFSKYVLRSKMVYNHLGGGGRARGLNHYSVFHYGLFGYHLGTLWFSSPPLMAHDYLTPSIRTFFVPILHQGHA